MYCPSPWNNPYELGFKLVSIYSSYPWLSSHLRHHQYHHRHHQFLLLLLLLLLLSSDTVLSGWLGSKYQLTIFIVFFFFFFITLSSHWNFSHGKICSLSFRKASYDRVVLPKLQHMLFLLLLDYGIFDVYAYVIFFACVHTRARWWGGGRGVIPSHPEDFLRSAESAQTFDSGENRPQSSRKA